MGVFWVKLGKKEKVFLHLGTYPYPQSDLTFRNGGSSSQNLILLFVGFDTIFLAKINYKSPVRDII